MDEQYLLACARYIELNPVRAGLVEKPDQWRWSSVRPHVKAKDDSLVTTQPLLKLVRKPWKRFLMDDVTPGEIDLFRRHEGTGRPLGSKSFVSKIENQLKRRLRPKGSITGLLTNHTLVSENKLKKHREKAGQSFSSPV